MATKHMQRIDKGRLVIVPLFTLFIMMSIFSFGQNLKMLQPISTFKIAALIHEGLIVCFYLLLVGLYFIRSAARSTTQSVNVRIIAIVSAFLPFAIPLLGSPSDNPGMLLAASMVTIFGMAVSLYALSVLGRSFSIIPQARELVQNGPYRLVRHPVYLGELIAIFGMVISRPSSAVIATFVLITAAIIYRALHEEKLLASLFPDYCSYSLNKARFIPGVF